MIAQIPTGQPSDLDPEAWYEAALCCAENQEANATFHGRLWSCAPLSRTTTILSLPKPSTSIIVPPLPPPTSAPVQMDIDATNPHRMVPPTCYQYGKPGHFQKDCSQRYDIWFMTMEKRDKWMNEEALQRDAVEIVEIVEVPEQREDTEGFRTCRE